MFLQGTPIRDVYVDFACRLSKTMQRYVSLQPHLQQASQGLRVMVNWMHGSSHDLVCQLTNNGRFQEGAGRKVGENAEQLWSMTKVCLVRMLATAPSLTLLTHQPRTLAFHGRPCAASSGT